MIFQPKLFVCLKNYTKKEFSSDLMAGIIVGIVALPLAIAFGIASGVGPTEGLVTAIIAGFIISLSGGSKVQIGGPTGAFIIIIYGIIQSHGLGGLMIATLMAGVMLVAIGAFKLGNVIKFVPYPVIVGFTAGIALTIFSTQMNDLFGLGINDVPADFINKWICYFKNITNINWLSLIIGITSLLIIIFVPKISKKIPGSLAAIVIMTFATWIMKRYLSMEEIITIGDIYELPTSMPKPSLPSIQFEEGQTLLNLIQTLFPAAFTIAMLGAIESLLSAMVADGVTGENHNSNTELIAQGIANIVTPFFGGIPATGAIARTMTNINNGGKTPISGIIHAVLLLFIMMLFGKLVGMIPMPCLAAVLIMVSYNMCGWRTIVALSKNPKADFFVMLLTFFLTVIFDLTVAIEVGLIASVALFLKRTNEATVIRSFHKEIDPNDNIDLHLNKEKIIIPEHVEVYEIDGPYFFGIANKFEEISKIIRDRNALVRIIRMRKVSFIDSTGIHNLEMLCDKCRKDGMEVVLSGVNIHVHNALEKSGLINKLGTENVCSHIDFALERAKIIVEKKMSDS